MQFHEMPNQASPVIGVAHESKQFAAPELKAAPHVWHLIMKVNHKSKHLSTNYILAMKESRAGQGTAMFSGAPSWSSWEGKPIECVVTCYL